MAKEDLIGRTLDSFTVHDFTEVYKTNDDGKKTKTIGFFRHEHIAKAFAQNQTDANWHKTRKALVVTDGKMGFLLGDEITILSDEKEALEIREKALEKLSPEERAILGL